jgi:hypothetical protein
METELRPGTKQVADRRSIFAVDAGSEKSAFVIFNPLTQCIESMGIEANADLLRTLVAPMHVSVFAFEKLTPYGFPVGKEVFETIEWNGRFRQAAERHNVTVFPVTRKACVVHHTRRSTGGDKEIRASMIARFPNEDIARCGSDIRSALAIAAYASDHLLSGGTCAGSRKASHETSAPHTGEETQASQPAHSLISDAVDNQTPTLIKLAASGKSLSSVPVLAESEQRFESAKDDLNISGEARGSTAISRANGHSRGAAHSLSPQVSATSKA